MSVTPVLRPTVATDYDPGGATAWDDRDSVFVEDDTGAHVHIIGDGAYSRGLITYGYKDEDGHTIEELIPTGSLIDGIEHRWKGWDGNFADPPSFIAYEGYWSLYINGTGEIGTEKARGSSEYFHNYLVDNDNWSTMNGGPTDRWGLNVSARSSLILSGFGSVLYVYAFNADIGGRDRQVYLDVMEMYIYFTAPKRRMVRGFGV